MIREYFKNSNGNSLDLLYTYVEYEGPLFFLCADAFDLKYLGAASVTNKEFESWTLVKVTPSRIMDVLHDQITLYDLFKNSESGEILFIKRYFSKSHDDFDIISSNNVSDDLLPAKGNYLNIVLDDYISCKLPMLENDEDFLASAVSTYTLNSDLEIVLPLGKPQNMIQVKQAGEILSSFDDLRISMLIENTSVAGRITNKLVEASSVMLVGTKAASFVFSLQARDNTIAEDDTCRSFSEIHDLFLFENRSDKFDEFLKSHNISVISRYKKFINVLMNSNFEFTIRTAFPLSNSVRKENLNSLKLAARKQLLDQIVDTVTEPIEMDGTLYGAEPIKAVFSFLPKDSEEFITGKIEASYAEQMRQNEDPHIIQGTGRIFLIKTTKYSINTNAYTETFEMSSFVANIK